MWMVYMLRLLVLNDVLARPFYTCPVILKSQRILSKG